MRKLFITLIAFFAYRICGYLPLPGINTSLVALFDYGVYDSTVNTMNLFLGGNLGRLSIFTLNLVPYLSANLILYGLTYVSPHLKRLKRHNQSNRLIKYSYLLTCCVAAIQYHLFLITIKATFPGVILFDWNRFYVLALVTLLFGLFLLIWLAEYIENNGIGSGINLLLLVGILSELPARIVATYQENTVPSFWFLFVVLCCLLGIVVYFEATQYSLLIMLPAISKFGPFEKTLQFNATFAGLIPLLLSNIGLSLLALFSARFSSLDSLSLEYIVVHAILLTILSYSLQAIFLDHIRYMTRLQHVGGFFPYVRPGLAGLLFTEQHVRKALLRH